MTQSASPQPASVPTKPERDPPPLATAGCAVTSHAFLRAATAIEHAALERDLRIAAADADDLDRVRFLAAFYGWLRATSVGLWDRGWRPAMAPRQRAAKLAWLAEDLGAAGVDAAALPMPTWNVPADLPGVRPALGYVHEGSLLGGAVLQRRWAAAGSKFASSRYLLGYGAQSTARWRTFLQELERLTPDQAARERAAAWAQEAFRSLRRWCAAWGILT